MLNTALKYLKYYITSVGPHGIHSPFVYELATKILPDKRPYEGYKQAETVRKQLLRDTTLINVTDYGAGAGNDGKKIISTYGKRYRPYIGQTSKICKTATSFVRTLQAKIPA